MRDLAVARRVRPWIVGLAAVWIAVVAGCRSGPARVEDTRGAMGTYVRIQIVLDDEDAARGAMDAAYAEIDQRHRFTNHLEPVGNLLELERHTDTTLDDLVSGDEQPEKRGKHHRQRLQSGMPERPGRTHAVCTFASRRRED